MDLWTWKHENQYDSIPISREWYSNRFQCWTFRTDVVIAAWQRCSKSILSTIPIISRRHLSFCTKLNHFEFFGIYSTVCVRFSCETHTNKCILCAMWCVVTFVWNMCKEVHSIAIWHVLICSIRTVCDLIIEETIHMTNIFMATSSKHILNKYRKV